MNKANFEWENDGTKFSQQDIQLRHHYSTKIKEMLHQIWYALRKRSRKGISNNTKRWQNLSPPLSLPTTKHSSFPCCSPLSCTATQLYEGFVSHLSASTVEILCIIINYCKWPCIIFFRHGSGKLTFSACMCPKFFSKSIFEDMETLILASRLESSSISNFAANAKYKEIINE